MLAGYEVITAKNGRKAVKQVVEHLPDLILMELEKSNRPRGSRR